MIKINKREFNAGLQNATYHDNSLLCRENLDKMNDVLNRSFLCYEEQNNIYSYWLGYWFTLYERNIVLS